MSYAKPKAARILARVTIDESHLELFGDLLSYTGRRRTKRIAFLAALGLLAERGALQANVPLGERQTATEESHPDKKGKATSPELRPLTADLDDIGFLSRLRESLP